MVAALYSESDCNSVVEYDRSYVEAVCCDGCEADGVC